MKCRGHSCMIIQDRFTIGNHGRGGLSIALIRPPPENSPAPISNAHGTPSTDFDGELDILSPFTICIIVSQLFSTHLPSPVHFWEEVISFNLSSQTNLLFPIPPKGFELGQYHFCFTPKRFQVFTLTTSFSYQPWTPLLNFLLTLFLICFTNIVLIRWWSIIFLPLPTSWTPWGCLDPFLNAEQARMNATKISSHARSAGLNLVSE